MNQLHIAFEDELFSLSINEVKHRSEPRDYASGLTKSSFYRLKEDLVFLRFVNYLGQRYFKTRLIMVQYGHKGNRYYIYISNFTGYVEFFPISLSEVTSNAA